MNAFVLDGVRRGHEGLADPASVPASTVWTCPTVGFRDVPEPVIEGPFDVIVRVSVCGICGSDLHCSECGPDGFVRFGGPARLPVTLGHEFTGPVLAIGSEVNNIAIGDIVTAESIWACWRCAECRCGHLNECRNVELLGLTVDGALAPRVRVDARHCYSIAPLITALGRQMAMEIGTLLEPLGVALRGLTRARMNPADRIAVVGAGPIGLGAIMLAIEAGATDVVAFDRTESRVALAEAAGARAFLLGPHANAGEAIASVHGSRGASLVVEAAGTLDGFQIAFDALANRGRLLVMGRMPDKVPFDTNTLLSKGLEIVGSRGHAGYDIFRTLIRKVANGTLDPSSLVTARFPFADVKQAFAHARAAAGGKTLIRLEDRNDHER